MEPILIDIDVTNPLDELDDAFTTFEDADFPVFGIKMNPYTLDRLSFFNQLVYNHAGCWFWNALVVVEKKMPNNKVLVGCIEGKEESRQCPSCNEVVLKSIPLGLNFDDTPEPEWRCFECGHRWEYDQ